MRILCTKTSRFKEESGGVSEYDAHHEYYVDDARGAAMVAEGRAYQLDANGRKVEPRPAAKKTAASKPVVQKPTGQAGKPASKRATKSVKPPENKTEPGASDAQKA
ncbi:hypothetical protein [Streptomyces sp. UG1]|uniref:hypothetical protein n=1 Tax=Streptomyces sp. UG1 TaxID=3417652 RepID=UPI003CF62E11